MAPNIAALTRNPAAVTRLKVREANSRSGMIGWGALRCRSTNSRLRIPPPSPSTTISGEPQGCSDPPQAVTSSSAVTPVTSRLAPRRSSRRSTRWWGRSSTREVTTNAAMPMGTLTRNTHRQSRWSTMKPPSSGPVIEATPKTAPR